MKLEHVGSKTTDLRAIAECWALESTSRPPRSRRTRSDVAAPLTKQRLLVEVPPAAPVGACTI